MVRRRRVIPIAAERRLAPVPICWVCQRPTFVAYHGERRIVHLWGSCRYTMVVRRCVNRGCIRCHVFVRPEEEGGLALPNGTFGLDVIAMIGHLRYGDQQSTREIHRGLLERGVGVAERTVADLVHRYNDLLAPPAAGPTGLGQRPRNQDRVILAVDGIEPERGAPVLWVLRDVFSGTVLLARSLRGAHGGDLEALIGEASAIASWPVTAVLYSGPGTKRE